MSLVYFIVAVQLGHVKIGHAKDPVQRLRDMQVGSPDRLVLAATAPGGYQMEQELHQRFDDVRLHGEWFRLIPGIEKVIVGCGGRLPAGVSALSPREAVAMEVLRSAEESFEIDSPGLHRLIEIVGRVAEEDARGREWPRLVHLQELAAAALGWAFSLDDDIRHRDVWDAEDCVPLSTVAA